ncbi:MAG: hypothetical protein ACI4VT_04750 [Bacilli bacterium]|nr:hypothetical protein [bacterium]MDY3757186.1 hypothetical protein [Bacilli bacterium]
MAMLYKNKALDINQELFTDYFNLNAIYNYDKIIIINDEELEKVLNQEKILKPLIINDKYPIYTLLNYLNNSSSIYLQKEYGILNQDELKESIKNYSKTIIASKELISYLKELDLIKEEYTLNKNEYLIVDKYQNNIKKAIK